MNRNAEGTPCECGGYMDKVEPTAKEIKKYNCGRPWNCCAAAFVCRVCKKREACKLDAPEME